VTNEPDTKDETKLGASLSEFEAGVEVLRDLVKDGKFHIFLLRGPRIKFIGEAEDFRSALARKEGSEAIDRRKADDCLQELKIFLQLRIATNSPAMTAEILEREYYEEAFGAKSEAPDTLASFRENIQLKIELVAKNFSSQTLVDRAKRLGTVIGPTLEDLDVEVVARRRSASQGVTIEGPFLRIALQYSLPRQSEFPFGVTLWAPEVPADMRSFEMECDETDIDLLITRLLQAKELLNKAIEMKLKADLPPSAE
jgi:hypothetical protein